MTDSGQGNSGTAWAKRSGGEQGIALITMMALLLIMTVLGMAAITISGFENRMVGFMRGGEASASAAEACLSTSVHVIRNMAADGSVDPTFLSDAGGPIPTLNKSDLEDELKGISENDPDTYPGAPNLDMMVNNYQVWGDIDRLYRQPKPGGQAKFGYGGSVDILYRVDCTASNVATGAETHLTSIYQCDLMPDGCLNPL